jgi:hypothetical protein
MRLRQTISLIDNDYKINLKENKIRSIREMVELRNENLINKPGKVINSVTEKEIRTIVLDR